LTPCYEAADKFTGLGERGGGVAPALRAYVAKEVREDAEIDRQRAKARSLREEGGQRSGGGGGSGGGDGGGGNLRRQKKKPPAEGAVPP